MKKSLLLLSLVFSGFASAQDCSKIFFSEYVEGRYNNKALEIYNPTNAAVDLSQYAIVRYSNGSTSATMANSIQLVGTLAPNDVHVGVLDRRDTTINSGTDEHIWDSIRARADEFYCTSYTISNAFNFNGNDAIALIKGTLSNTPTDVVNNTNIPGLEIIDIFGKIGEDPGDAWSADFPYTGAGAWLTKDHSLLRKASVQKGETNVLISHFNALLEYDSIPAEVTVGGVVYGNWNTLGSHTCDCHVTGVDEATKEALRIYPNPSNGSFNISGLNDFSSITIVNALGQNVKNINVEGKLTTSFSLELKGLYFVQLKTNNGDTITKKVIVK